MFTTIDKHATPTRILIISVLFWNGLNIVTNRSMSNTAIYIVRELLSNNIKNIPRVNRINRFLVRFFLLYYHVAKIAMGGT